MKKSLCFLLRKLCPTPSRGSDHQLPQQANKKTISLASHPPPLVKDEQKPQALLNQINQLQAQLKTMEQRLERAQQEMADEKNAPPTRLFENERKIHQCYHQLPPAMQQNLTGIFKDTSPNGLIACGVQEKNITSLWDYIKHQIMADVPVEGLIELFYGLFDLYQKANPQFALLPTCVGERFDAQQHIRCAHSPTSGYVKQAVLRGWQNTKTHHLIKPTIVDIQP